MRDIEPRWKREERAFDAWWEANGRKVPAMVKATRDVAASAGKAGEALRGLAQACRLGREAR